MKSIGRQSDGGGPSAARTASPSSAAATPGRHSATVPVFSTTWTRQAAGACCEVFAGVKPALISRIDLQQHQIESRMKADNRDAHERPPLARIENDAAFQRLHRGGELGRGQNPPRLAQQNAGPVSFGRQNIDNRLEVRLASIIGSRGARDSFGLKTN